MGQWRCPLVSAVLCCVLKFLSLSAGRIRKGVPYETSAQARCSFGPRYLVGNRNQPPRPADVQWESRKGVGSWDGQWASDQAAIESPMKVYCDTNTLMANIRNEPAEQAAVKILVGAHEKGIVVLYGSNISHREVMKTRNPVRRQQLASEAEQRQRVLKNEHLLGFHTHDMGSRGFVSHPLMSDVQDDALCRELEQQGLDRADAQHITQAVCNACGVFLTRDRETIIEPHRVWLEARFPNFRVRLPSELVAELGHAGVL